MLSSYDRWATKEGPDFKPLEIAQDMWFKDIYDESLEPTEYELIAPFDSTICDGCSDVIGAYLYADEQTGTDNFTFTPFWMMDEDGETLFCEDCYIDATTETV
jgi:hypothetical protein